MAEDLYEQTREEVASFSGEHGDEGELERVLHFIAERASEDLGATWDRPDSLSEGEAEELLGHIDAWASLASHVTYETYVGPLREVGAARRRVAGWAKGVGSRLAEFANLLTGYLRAAMRALRAQSFSISVGFPFGISVGLSW